MADKAWKQFERRVAAYFGGKRCPVLGTETKADVDHETLYVECKQRVKHSVVTLWDNTRRRADNENLSGSDRLVVEPEGINWEIISIRPESMECLCSR